MSTQFELSDTDRKIFVEQIVQVGLAALQSRAKGGHKESEEATRKEAEAVVQAAYSSSTNQHELMLKIGKMVRKLDPYAAVNSFMQQRPLLLRLHDVENAITQRDRALLQSVLKRGAEPAGLIQAIDEVMKANSMAKKYKALEQDLLLVQLPPVINKLQIAMALKATAEQLFHTCTEEIPKMTHCLTQLALAPAIRAHITACLVHLPSGTTTEAGVNVRHDLAKDPSQATATKIHCEALLRIVMTLVMSARECGEVMQERKHVVGSIVSVLRPPAAPVASIGITIVQ